MPKGKIYLVASYSWEYNDQYNYMPEGDPMYPQFAFEDKDKAEKLCLKSNINALKGLTLNHSPDGLHGILENGVTVDEFIAFMRSVGANGFSEDDPVIPDDLPNSVYIKILDMLNIRFYTVLEVPRRF